MKLIPRTQWICDTCGEIITRPEQGWLEYLTTDLDKGSQCYRFRIIHHASYSPRNPNRPSPAGRRGQTCYDEEGCTSGDHLNHVVGVDGLQVMLGMIDKGVDTEPKFNGPHVVDLREWTELVRRLALPHYEEARLYWNNAKEAGWFDGANELFLYSQKLLTSIIEEFGEKDFHR